MKNKPNYGIDAPNVMYGLIFGAFIISFLYLLLMYYMPSNPFIWKVGIFSIDFETDQLYFQAKTFGLLVLVS